MVEISKLDAAVVAKHLAVPEGEIGLAVGDSMNRRNWPIYEAAFRQLDIRQPSQLLEIGFGNGKFLPRLFELASLDHYSGIDLSETMVTAAKEFNDGIVREGKADFKCASVEAIPYPDCSFDYALAINVIYFWQEPLLALKEIRRVLKKGGVLFMSAGEPTMMAKSPYARHGFRLYDATQLAALHEQAKFFGIRTAEFCDTAPKLTGEGDTPRVNIFISSHR